MSLLTNPWFQVGMGLLANSGPSLTPVNPWRGIGQGLMAANEAKVMEAEQQYLGLARKQQEDEWRRAEERRGYLDQMVQRETDPQLAAMARVAPDEYIKRKMSAGGSSAKLTTAGDLGLQGFDPQTPVQVKYENGVEVGYEPINPPQNDPQTAGIEMQRGGEVYTAASVDEANKLAQQGWTYYRPPPNTVINNNMGAGDKLSVPDSRDMVWPDGTPIKPGTDWEEIIAKGGRALTTEEKAAASESGRSSAENSAALSKGENLMANYREAAKNYADGWSPYGQNDARASVARDIFVKWVAKNVLGKPGAEPSPALYQQAEAVVPDYGGPFDRYVFEAKMAEAERSIKAALEAKEKQGNDSGGNTDGKTIEVVRDPRTGRLVPKQ